jgi:glycosyltransferase involved in cell wall biosynthesis
MFYKPCEDGARWLIREILPLVRRHIANVETWIVGQGPGPGVLELAGNRVSVTGEVEDVQPHYEQATVAVAPLRAGSGSRLKILEAMALGRAVVSTTLGAEGLEVEAGKHLLIADGAAEFGDAIVELIQNPALRGRLTNAARDLVEQRYDWDTIATRQLRIYREMMES